MNGHRLRVWAGRDGLMFVSCFSVSIVVSGFSYFCTILAVSATWLVCNRHRKDCAA